MLIQNRDLKRRIIEISYERKLSHIGSCLGAVDTIVYCFEQMQSNDKFVLSNGHAGLALYVVLEKYYGKNAIAIFDHHGVHPDRCDSCGIQSSAGSLGHGIGIGLGMAISDPNITVFCTISDGECAEGSVWETFRIQKEQNIENLWSYCIINSYGAYDEINPIKLSNQLEYMSWCRPMFVQHPLNPKWLSTQEAHYKVMDEAEYKEFMEVLS